MSLPQSKYASKLANKRVFILGGSSGIGFCVAEAATAPLVRPTLADVTIEQIRASGDMRTISTLILAKYALRYMNRSPVSSLTFTAGSSVFRPPPGWSVFAAVAGGPLIAGIPGLAVDMKPIPVNLVAPGATDTPFWDGVPGREAIQEAIAKKTLTGAIGNPEDTAEAYLYCMKDKAFTGQTLLTSGGDLLM